MALTREIITANAELSGLTEAQINAITTLSQNDENSVIGQRIGEVYRQMDTTIASATGVQRNGDEKTYNYLERATKELSEKAKGVDGLTSQIANLTKEKARLEKVIAEGAGDAETKKALDQARKDLTAITKQFTDLKNEYDTAKANHSKELFDVKVDYEITQATSGIQFKAEYPQSVTRVLLDQAVAKIKGMNPEYIDDGKGGKVLAYHDATGALLRNSENKLEPFTTNELLTKELKSMGVLAEGKPATGTGTGNNQPNPTATYDLSGARTRTEAMDIISKQLMSEGLTIGSEAYQIKLDQAWADNNISALPLN